MKKYTVTIAVNVPSYADTEVEAESQEAADAIVQQSIDNYGWNSPFYAESRGWKDIWEECQDLRVVAS